MRRFLACFCLVLTAGCTSLSGVKTRSNWATLAEAKSAKCAAWPLRDKDLGIKDIRPVEGAGRGFTVSLTKRDGA